MSDKQFIVVSEELFQYLTGYAIEIDEDYLELDDVVTILYEVYMQGRQDSLVDIYNALGESLGVGDEMWQDHQ